MKKWSWSAGFNAAPYLILQSGLSLAPVLIPGSSCGSTERFRTPQFTLSRAITPIVGISNTLAERIAKAHREFLLGKFNSYAELRNRARPPKHLGKRKEHTSLPTLAEDAHYFMEMKFAIWPWFVLTDHPDGNVKTTAWLTVLTSIFAMFMQWLYQGL